MIKINCIDHLVLTVKDIETTCAFYERILGLEVVERSGATGRLSPIYLRDPDENLIEVTNTL
jgi:catechol 2,3-dioxygenase-like lactoylglutathione lyase family enzyme